jgi:Na+-transporting methylmalonyl-CoA/oxaloacetate decarboxylase gamma subunit
LVIIIFLFGKIFDIINQKAAQAKSADAANQAPKVSAPRSVPAAAPAPAVPAATDDDEVIAVISAAIAMMSEADGKTYQVRSIKPAAGGLGGRTAWAMDGRRQNVMPF